MLPSIEWYKRKSFRNTFLLEIHNISENVYNKVENKI